MRQIIDDSNAVFAKAAAAVAALVEQKPDAVIGITEVDMPEAFFAKLRESGVSFAGVTFCNACELAGEAGKGAQSQAAKLNTLLYDAVHPKTVLLPTTADYDAAIRAAGAPLDAEPSMGCDGNWQCWTHDPDGNRIELMQMMPDSCQDQYLKK